MSACATLVENASAGVAPALRAVDCLANQTTASAFGRLFGNDGALLPALTLILTLYIAFFAISLLTGRSSIGVSALTPRMLTLGVALTVATSWVAYQGVVWNLAVGGPDEIASVLMGSKDSATQVFADRIDLIFAVIAEVGQATTGSAEGAAQTIGGQGSFSPGNLMWLAALLLLLGTVGVLVTARIALAVLLALGPIFVIFAIFPGTRGLTAGWLRGVVLTAVTPLFVVLGGGIMLELMVPVVARLNGLNGVDGRAALALFTIAAVHVALMAMVFKVAGSLVAGWQVFGLARREGDSDGSLNQPVVPSTQVIENRATPSAQALASTRRLPTAAIAASIAPQEAVPGSQAPSVRLANGSRTMMIAQHAGTGPALPPRQGSRARGIGSRFQSQTRKLREIAR